MKYKVGDKVRIRKDLKVGDKYGSKIFTSTMLKYCGKETTITKFFSNFYTVAVDNETWYWSNEMLEPVKDCDFKVGDEVIFKPDEKDKLTGVFTVSEIDMDLGIPYIKLKEVKECMWFNPNRLFKVPLFKVGQIVQFKDITKDRWYTGTDVMANLEGKLGIISEITEDNYTADKPGQDGCRYKVLYLQKETQGYVTSASLVPVPTIASLDDIKVTRGDDPGPRGDIGVVTTAEAIAQAVDNVKGPQFKIGDKVVIRNDLVAGKEYTEWNGWIFRGEMAQYKGKIATIVEFRNCDSRYYSLDIDEKRWSWIQDSLMPYTPGSDYDLDKQIINQQTKQNYENQLQGKEEPLIGGCECTGTGVCYPGEQVATCIGHLGYRKIAYRS